ncbi:MAG: galactokinase [Erysipelotrichaceae bacterium]|nr:galactokinase [Erysipelotrichaceae bacterium]
MKISELSECIKNGNLDQKFQELYGKEEIPAQRKRYSDLLTNALKLYGDKEAMIFSAPGRTEVGGNHTDHQLGSVLAASLNLDCIAAVIPTEDAIVRYNAKGFEVDPVDLHDLTIHKKEKNTTEALIRGVAAGLVKRGYHCGGFEAFAQSDVIAGGGMSSSAAFEVLIGTIQNNLYNADKVSAPEIAKIGQYAENEYFMKPSGLLDQMACSVGSFAAIDFADPENPAVEKVPFDPADYGYALVLTDVKASHADLSDEYGLIPTEMKQVASVLGKKVLGQTSAEELISHVKEIRETCGDRAFLRSYHYVNETRRAKAEAAALKDKDISEFLKLVRESGHSSYMYLQNINVPGETRKQPIAVALALSEAVIGENGAYRVHGGGFAGTIQAFVKKQTVQKYIATLENAFGKGCCYILRIRNIGGTRIA